MKNSTGFLFSMLIALFFCSNTSYGQAAKSYPPNSLYSYYMYISGVESKEDVKAISKAVHKSPKTVYFLADRFPVRFFELHSPDIITKDTLESWLPNNKYKVDIYGMGEQYKEQVLVEFFKRGGKHGQ